MSDISDDEELQRLREAALKSKRRPAAQDVKKDNDPEVQRMSPSRSQVPATLTLHPPEGWNPVVQPLPHVFRPYFIQQSVLQAPQPQIILRMPQPQHLHLPQPLQMPQMNDVHFQSYPPPFISPHPQGSAISSVGSGRPLQRIKSHPKLKNATSDLKQTGSQGFRSNLIVITGHGNDSNSRTSSPFRPITSTQSNVETCQPVKTNLKPNPPVIVRPQDKWASEKDDLTQEKDEKVKMSKFERYKADDSSGEEEENISSTDSSSATTPNYIEEFKDHYAFPDCARIEGIEIRDDKDLSSDSERTSSTEDDNSHFPIDKEGDESSKLHQSSDTRDSNVQDDDTMASTHDEPEDEVNKVCESVCNESNTRSSTSPSSTATSSPSTPGSPAKKERFLSFSDDVEDFHLDIPDEIPVRNASFPEIQDDYQKPDEEKIPEEVKDSSNKQDRHHHSSSRTPTINSRSSSDKIKSTSSRDREKETAQSAQKRHKPLKCDSYFSKPRSSKNANSSSKTRSGDSLVIKYKRHELKKMQQNFKRGYEEMRQDDYYERGHEDVRERAYKKQRYCDDREMNEYHDEYKEYPRHVSDSQRHYDKNDVYSMRETSDDHYFYVDVRKPREDHPERSHESFYKEYYDVHGMGHDDDRYRYTPPPPPHRRCRVSERDYYSDIADREAVRAEVSRRYDDDDYYSSRSASNKIYPNNPIPSLLDGIYPERDLDKRQVVENIREKYHSLKSTVSSIVKSQVRDSKQFPQSRTKENRRVNNSKSKMKMPKEISKNKKKYPDEATDVVKYPDEATDVVKPSRRVIKSKDDAGFPTLEICAKLVEKKLRSSQEPCNSNDAKPSGADRKTFESSTLESNQTEDQPKNNKHRQPIHHRLGSKPEKKSSVMNKKTDGSDLRHRLAVRRNYQVS